MQLIIDIPKEIYDYIRNEHIAMRVCDGHKVAKAIYNGTPLYKDDEVHSHDMLDLIYAHTLEANALDLMKQKAMADLLNVSVGEDSKESKQTDSVTTMDLTKLSKQLIDIESQLDGGLDKSDSDALLLAASILRNKVLEQDPILDKIRAEIAEYGSIRVAYAITDETYTDKGIEELVTDVLSEAKRQMLCIIDKYKAESESER